MRPTPMSHTFVSKLWFANFHNQGSHIVSESLVEVHHPLQTPKDGLSTLRNSNLPAPSLPSTSHREERRAHRCFLMAETET